MTVYIMLIYLCPLILLACNLKQLRNWGIHWFFIGYNWFLKRRVKEQQHQIEKDNYRTVYLNEDEKGAYIILGKSKIHLNAMKAKPLHGFLAGNSYYTTDQSEKLTPIVPKRDF
jgi:hypothetical protein